jgi:hypothetical protein
LRSLGCYAQHTAKNYERDDSNRSHFRVNLRPYFAWARSKAPSK